MVVNLKPTAFPAMVGQTFLKKLQTKFLSRNLNSALAWPSTKKNTLQRLSSTSASWQSTTHWVGGLEVEIGQMNPESTNGEAPPARDNHAIANSVLAVHASGCSYKQWGKIGPLLSCSLVAPNLYGYGRSEPWPSNRTPDIADYVALLTSAKAPPPVHLIGHSMGGGIALAAAATSPDLKLSSITVFEPNLFCLLAAGTPDDRKMWSEALKFFEGMLNCASREAWEEWGQLFHAFWFDDQGAWSRLDDLSKQKLVGSTVPHTVYEIQAIMSTMERGDEYAKNVLESLSILGGQKRVVLGNAQCLARQPSLALAELLKQKAGFQVVQAPVGGHMGPLTHPHQVLPLLLHQTIMRPKTTFSFN